MNSMKNIMYKKSVEEERKIIEIEKTLAIPYPMKTNYNIIIPTNIFQTWHSKILPPLMAQSIFKIRNLNPKFNYFLFDDNDCREFIKLYFRKEVLDAYDKLIPGAYKADLWRYCVLFIKGGIYLDIKYTPLNGFKFINLTESEHLVYDTDCINVYNALMVCLPGNKLLIDAINTIVENVKNKFYGDSYLEPTGPKLLSKLMTDDDKPVVDLQHKEFYNDSNYRIIYFNNIPILKSYKGHAAERDQNSIKKHYSYLWNQRRVYL
jgi:mannosyltransferase OCH1-like enzyme